MVGESDGIWNVLTLHRLLRHEGTLLWSHGLTLLGEFLHYAALVALDLAQHRVAHAAFSITSERSGDQALLKSSRLPYRSDMHRTRGGLVAVGPRTVVSQRSATKRGPTSSDRNTSVGKGDGQ